jgi:hypothetical protein
MKHNALSASSSGGSRRRDRRRAARGASHAQLGRTLADVDHEWAAVPLFYSAYHLVKLAMLRDPIWDRVNALQTLHQGLIPDDRFTERHKGRQRRGEPRQWGVNEIVSVLYKNIARPYERLHLASIDVRYGVGLDMDAMPDLLRDLALIEDLESSGAIVAPIPFDEP